jgi:hypothetical protein
VKIKQRGTRKRNEMNWRTKKHHMILSAHLSVPAGFIIVSFPEEAAFTIWFSTDLFILALSAYVMIQQVTERGEGK